MLIGQDVQALAHLAGKWGGELNKCELNKCPPTPGEVVLSGKNMRVDRSSSVSDFASLLLARV